MVDCWHPSKLRRHSIGARATPSCPSAVTCRSAAGVVRAGVGAAPTAAPASRAAMAMARMALFMAWPSVRSGSRYVFPYITPMRPGSCSTVRGSWTPRSRRTLGGRAARSVRRVAAEETFEAVAIERAHQDALGHAAVPADHECNREGQDAVRGGHLAAPVQQDGKGDPGRLDVGRDLRALLSQIDPQDRERAG